MLRCMPARETRARSLPRAGGLHRESAPNLHDRHRTRVPRSPVRWPRRSPARSSDRDGRRASQTANEWCPVNAAPAPVKSPPAEAPCAIGTCSDSSVKFGSAAGKKRPVRRKPGQFIPTLCAARDWRSPVRADNNEWELRRCLCYILCCSLLITLMIALTFIMQNRYAKCKYVTLDHKTSHKINFF